MVQTYHDLKRGVQSFGKVWRGTLFIKSQAESFERETCGLQVATSRPRLALGGTPDFTRHLGGDG
jgi:hypothetical protein